jgi:hypothetical protein
VERLRRYLEVSQATLEVAEREMQFVRDQQVATDNRVAGEFFVLFRFEGSHLFFALIVFVCWEKLEVELLEIREAADVVAEYVHARSANREEHLLDLPNHVRDVVELGIHRGGRRWP